MKKMRQVTFYMTATAALFACSFGRVQASTVFTEDFSSYGAGTSIGTPNWNQKWDGTDTTQQNLFTGEAGGTAVLDMSAAKSNYHLVSQTGVSINAGGEITISVDMQFEQNGLGNGASANTNIFGTLISTGDKWFNGTNKDLSIANSNAAVRNRLPVAPWVENWQQWSTLGVDFDANVGLPAGTSPVVQVSDWFTQTTTITVNAAGNYSAVAMFTDGNDFSMTTSPIDLGIAAGTTIYPGLTTAWHAGTTTKETETNVSAARVDNFSVSVVPEPGNVPLIMTGLAFLFVVGLRATKNARRR